MGDAAKHRCMKLIDAYRTELKRNRVGNPPTLGSRLEVDRKLSELDRKLAAVQQSGQIVEDQVYEHIQNAVQHGQDLAEEQVNLLLADELEAKRQLEQANWLEHFLDEGVKALPPADFLSAWLQVCKAREEFAAFGGLNRPHSVAGLRVEGTLRVAANKNEKDGGTGGDKKGRGMGASGSSPAAVTFTPGRALP